MTLPLNTEYNRMTSLLEQYGHVQIDFIKSGIVYFRWMPLDGPPRKVKCEQGLFRKNFRCSESMEETKVFMSIDEKKAYLDYPFGLIQKKVS